MTGGLGAIKLNGQSCSSEGYRMAVTQSECEDIARRLGLSYASLDAWGDPQDCDDQRYYRCEYYQGDEYYQAVLYWNPDCADNTESTDEGDNLCISGIWKRIK